MKGIRFFGAILGLCLVSSLGFAETAAQALTKKRAIADLETIKNVFEVHYAPLKWKGEFADWDLDKAFLEAKNKISKLSSPTLKDCQVVVRDFLNSTKDYHVGIRFFSTESASLPFLVRGANGHYFIVQVDRDRASTKDFPLEVGDEILTFDGKPVHEVIQNLRVKEFGSNVYETDQALAELSLTHRRGDLGNIVPSGKVTLTGKNTKTNKVIDVKLNWAYTPEKIQDFSKLGATFLPTEAEWKNDFPLAIKKSQFFDKAMVAHFWDKSFVGASLNLSKHSIGSRVSYIPTLGKKIWDSGSDSIFDAYIFKSPTGKNVGYIRIPHYIGDEEEVLEFGLLMNYFQKRTDALVIDQINNPGGSVFYLYGLAATLTDKPIYAPKHRLALTQDEVFSVHYMLAQLDKITDDTKAREAFGETVGGYPIDYEFVQLTRQFCQFVIDEWNNGKLYTDATFLYGVDKIKPHPFYNYNKPILVLINSLDFSAGDFFPSIMQDSKRATLFGTRTSGAGGYVLSNSFPNHSGIRVYAHTGSMAMRIDQKPIENLGVVPDITYEITENDLKDNYKEYTASILNAVEALIPSS